MKITSRELGPNCYNGSNRKKTPMVDDDFAFDLTEIEFPTLEMGPELNDLLKGEYWDYDEWAASGFPMGGTLAPAERAVFLEGWERVKKEATPADSAALKLIETAHKLHVANMKKLHSGGWRPKTQ